MTTSETGVETDPAVLVVEAVGVVAVVVVVAVAVAVEALAVVH